MSTRALDVLHRAIAAGMHEPTEKRVRVVHAGHTVGDTRRALVVWEPRRIVASYAFPVEDLDCELVPAAAVGPNGTDPADLPVLHPGIPFAVHTSEGESLTVRIPGATREGAAFRPADPDLAGYVVVDFFSFDDWYEEDERIVGHPRSPFGHIDIRRSSRNVRIELDGHVLAQSSRPTMLFETGLPPRYYLPHDDVRMDLLHPTTTRTWCAYKGQAAYWTLELPDRTMPDVAWTYEAPLFDVAPIKGLVAFFDERVDVIVDGERRERPRTEFAKAGFQDGTKRP
jgi:uncharacterized protein (DUF427 family)